MDIFGAKREQRVDKAIKLMSGEEFLSMESSKPEGYRNGFNDAMILVRHAFNNQDLGTWGFPQFVLDRAKSNLEI